MLDFSAVKSITIPEGEVLSVACGGAVLWEKPSAALYPFVNGTWEYTDGSWIEVTNGNHVRYYATGTKKYFNVSNIEQNTTTSGNLSNINNKETWFTIPGGAECVLEALNAGDRLQDCNFRLANATKSASFFLGDDENIRSLTVTTTADINIGCFFIYPDKSGEFELDLQLTVNGERWI